MSRRIARTAAVAVVALLGAGAVVAALDDGSPKGDMASTEAGQESESFRRDKVEVTESDAVGSIAPVSGRVASDEAYPAAPGAPAPAAAQPGEATGPPPSPEVGPAGLGGTPVPELVGTGTSRIVKTAAVSLSVDKGDLAGAQEKALAAIGTDGWVQSSDASEDRASYVLKVPVERLPGVLAQLRELGEVRSESQSGADVSAEYVDLEARLRHWRAQEVVFVGLMGKAKTIGETVQIQQQLSTVQQQIEQIEGRRRFLEGQTTFSTIELSLVVDGAVAKTAEEPQQTTLARAWERATGGALDVLAGTIVVLGVALPLVLILGLPALTVLAFRRRSRGTPVTVG